MDISAGLIAKGTAGALAASAAVGTGIIAKNNGWLDFNKSASDGKPKEGQIELTKFDQGLIDFLKIDGGDIVFEVKKGTGDITADNLTLDGTNPLSLTAKVTVDKSSDTNLKEKADNTDPKGKRETLQKLNGTGEGTPWTWTCEVKFETSETSLDGKSINDKDKIFKATDQGLFGLLRKSEANGSENTTKKAKEKFIKFCAKERGNEKNKAINATGIPSDSSNNLKSEIIINLKVGVAGAQDSKTETTKLYPLGVEDDRKFNGLFN